MPYPIPFTLSRRRLARLALAAVAALCLLTLLAPADSHAALQNMAGYEKGADNQFQKLYAYLANLRDAVLPLAIPVGTLGLIAGGGAYMFGNPRATTLIAGVVVGLGVILGAPTLIA